jgi:peptidoglycan/xylan/chitin deacetylase (PgdA/CDA1 family)
MAAALPARLFVVRGSRQVRTVYLTFDDGPDRVHTPPLLDLLRAEGVKATFFVVGRCAAACPDLIRRMVEEGHAVGHHTYSHSAPNCTSARRLMAEIAQTSEVLIRSVGFSPNLFRPPHGKLTPSKLWHLWRTAMTVVLWNVDPRDFACQSGDELRGRLSGYAPQAGDVLLFHDDRPHALAALPELIARVRTTGLEFATFPGQAGRPPAAPLPGVDEWNGDGITLRRSPM